MKCFIITLIILVGTVSSLTAEEPVPSDCDVLTDLLSLGIRNSMNSHSSFGGTTAIVSYPHGVRLSAQTKEAIEALFTAEGFSLTPEARNADYRFTIAVTDARVILQKIKKQVERSVSVTVHISCTDSSQRVIFASGHRESYMATIPENLMNQTDDSRKFSEYISRVVFPKNHDLLRITTLVLIMGTLLYYAFQ